MFTHLTIFSIDRETFVSHIDVFTMGPDPVATPIIGLINNNVTTPQEKTQRISSQSGNLGAVSARSFTSCVLLNKLLTSLSVKLPRLFIFLCIP